MPFVYTAKHLTPLGEVRAHVGDLAGPSYDKPEWICVESGAPGRWVRVPQPLDLDAIQARVRNAYRSSSQHESLTDAIADVQVLFDEVRRLRDEVARLEQAAWEDSREPEER